MSETMTVAVAKLNALNANDLGWVLRRAGQKVEKGADRVALLDAAATALKKHAVGEGDAAVLDAEAAGWLDEVGDGRPASAAKTEKELNVAVELAKLQKLPAGSLRERYTALYGKPVKTGNRQFLIKKIAWKIQEQAHGGLSEKAKVRAAAVLDTSVVGRKAPAQPKEARPRDARLPASGSVLKKLWREKTIEVLVGENEFEFEGQKWRSISAIASKLLGCPANGFLFFGLQPEQKEAADKREAKEAKTAAKEAADAANPHAPGKPKAAKKSKKPSKKGAQ